MCKRADSLRERLVSIVDFGRRFLLVGEESLAHRISRLLRALEVELGSDSRRSFILTRVILQTGVDPLKDPGELSKDETDKVAQALLDMGFLRGTIFDDGEDGR